MSDPIDQLKRELLAAADRRQQPALRPRRSRTHFAAAAAALVLALTAAALTVQPWSGSTSVLAQAEAALRPADDVVLHQEWVATTTSKRFGCTVTHRPSALWIDQAPPHRFRVRLEDAPPPTALQRDARALACWDGAGVELGGALDTRETQELTPEGDLRPAPRFGHPVDLVADLRRALEERRARDQGETTRDGRTVRELRVDPPTGCTARGCPREPTDWYVDPETFRPVAMEGPAVIDIPGRPLVELRSEVRFLVYEELPRTDANRRLTDITRR